MPERRTDLDWLRIGAFGLLILFHVGMVFGPDEWEVKSAHTFAWVGMALEWSAPWRLMLLFMISGAAVSFMCRRLSPSELFRSRSAFLLPPLLFAVLLISPPQLYIQAIEQFGYRAGFQHFLASYFHFGPPVCDVGRCLPMPGWEHLWFVAYLWIYTSLLCAILALVPRDRLRAAGRLLARGPLLLVLPAFYLATVRMGLEHFFPETHGLTDDWYLHVVFFSAIVAGFVLLPDETMMKRFERLRWIALAVGLVVYPLRVAYTWHYHGGLPIPLGLKVVMAFDYGFDQWSWVIVAIGFASRHLRQRDGAARRYLTEAIFPYYIVHQPVIIFAAHELGGWSLAAGVEALLLVGLCAAGCALVFEVVRRVDWLRPWFGIRPLNRTAAAGIHRLA